MTVFSFEKGQGSLLLLLRGDLALLQAVFAVPGGAGTPLNSRQSSVPRLLGREGVFDHFRVCYDDVGRLTDFILREEQG